MMLPDEEDRQGSGAEAGPAPTPDDAAPVQGDAKSPGAGLPEPPNVVGWLWNMVLVGGRALGVPVPDDDLPQTQEEREALFSAELATAAQEDYLEFDRLDCLQLCGPDRAGRPILLLIGARLPAWRATDKRRFARYVFRALERVAASPAFTIVYCHTDVTDANQPGASWLFNTFEALPETVQERLAALFVVHPAATLRGTLALLPFVIFSPFASGALPHKTLYCDRLEQLWEHIDPGAMQLPAFIAEHDHALAEHPLMDYGVVGPPTTALARELDVASGMPADMAP